MSVLIETSLGDIVIDLYVEECPVTCKNFLKLCKVKYYNFCAFYNVQKDFIVQTGDPTATGTGGTSIYGLLEGPKKRFFNDEIRADLRHKQVGTVSMASFGAGLNGSQFFITTGKELDYLDDRHTVFGQVQEGFDVLEKINMAICDEKGRPYQDIRIRHTIILDDPFDDPEGLEVPDKSPEPTEEMLKTVRIADDEDLEAESKLPIEVIEKQTREREAKAQALTLEMIGDLPFAEIKPPENVLFVCKLNPVTRDEDLELIFSRFGQINSCEVIRDKKTGDSLCYAFIEFEEKESCEEAYFKMDNVLIDDRRIHVDFSQSVSKLHGDWVNSRESRNDTALGNGLSFRKKYRDGEARDNDGKYDLVFENEDNLEHEKSERYHLGHRGRNQRETGEPEDDDRETPLAKRTRND